MYVLYDFLTIVYYLRAILKSYVCRTPASSYTNCSIAGCTTRNAFNIYFFRIINPLVLLFELVWLIAWVGYFAFIWMGSMAVTWTVFRTFFISCSSTSAFSWLLCVVKWQSMWVSLRNFYVYRKSQISQVLTLICMWWKESAALPFYGRSGSTTKCIHFILLDLRLSVTHSSF